MRLLNVRSHRLEDFMGRPPAYAILSHIWEAEEVLFSDIIRDCSQYENKKGFLKIKYSCLQAIKDQMDYVWIDTCCIDKSSSAELSEAINSMDSGWTIDVMVNPHSNSQPTATMTMTPDLGPLLMAQIGAPCKFLGYYPFGASGVQDVQGWDGWKHIYSFPSLQCDALATAIPQLGPAGAEGSGKPEY
ncbi:uncharacterized protein E0L32_002426 [Thyridium curvatum]|uniref:Heterokaryon incompatibility domain-containing protein n=1 Tax=Thyridium curvatum TaxID=1093900 RepID=A0A507BM39_9PEZI|nr:uncharacterized protein E0L32_002426 [Thyridium curvatum]TPX18569.1 hypothetical protein E0L32_002426 [Thyridium curvatum]